MELYFLYLTSVKVVYYKQTFVQLLATSIYIYGTKSLGTFDIQMFQTFS